MPKTMSFGSLKSREPAASFHHAGFALGAEREQNLTFRAQLHDGVRADVGGPDVAVLIDAQAVAAREQAFSEGANEFPVLVELRERLARPGSAHRDGLSNRTSHLAMLPFHAASGTGSGFGHRHVI